MNIEKVTSLTGLVERTIQLRGLDTSLSEEVLLELITQCVDFSGQKYLTEETEAVKRNIMWKYQIFTTPGQSILSNYDMERWYDSAKESIEPLFWTRYKDYLIDKKHFSPNVVSTLSEETLDNLLMNCILDPKKDYSSPILRKGLVIGDVQSGKTSTYIGFICKAADAGYKVFILLTGTIESLRKQTQERVEEGFIGIDMSSNASIGKRVGVGEDNKPILAMGLTSRVKDFSGDSNKIAVALSDKNAVVFVIKKQKDVLTKLKEWLLSLNADPISRKIDIPMILIDDEADNASINTKKDDDPTTINRLIRELASIFTKSNYIGFTATPFANVFINPNTTEEMETQDLFPEDFIVSLPTPSNYIGPNNIFSPNGEYHSQLEYITDAGCEEEDGFSFYFKHDKNWEGDLPYSMTDALYTFYLSNAIRDLRGDTDEHRTMMINMSRFVKVQKYIKGKVEEIHSDAYRSIKFNLSDDLNKSCLDPTIKRIYDVWNKQYSDNEFSWKDVASVLFKSIENIQIKIINSSKSSDKLDYQDNKSLRVIAIGGLALSRGLTLEGLVVSYFYRNTCTYDVLMQMGRWFGYRRGYEDLFRIWTHKDSAMWYAEIAEATEILKEDMNRMREMELKPRDFGIRVRNDSDDLSITSRSKMRNAIDEFEFSSYFGNIVETPYVIYNAECQKMNYKSISDFVQQLLDDGYSFERQDNTGKYFIQRIPKSNIAKMIQKLKISRMNSNFDVKQIYNFIIDNDDQCLDYFDMFFMEGSKTNDESLIDNFCSRKIYKVLRRNCVIDSKKDYLGLGRRGKLGGPSDGINGVVDFDGEKASDLIENAKLCFKRDYKNKNGYEFGENRVYPSNTWFSYIEKRRPIIYVYLVDVNYDDSKNNKNKQNSDNQKKQIDLFRQKMNGTPIVALAIGFPKNDNVSSITSKYKANKIYNWFDRDALLLEGEEE